MGRVSWILVLMVLALGAMALWHAGPEREGALSPTLAQAKALTGPAGRGGMESLSLEDGLPLKDSRVAHGVVQAAPPGPEDAQVWVRVVLPLEDVDTSLEVHLQKGNDPWGEPIPLPLDRNLRVDLERGVDHVFVEGRFATQEFPASIPWPPPREIILRPRLAGTLRLELGDVYGDGEPVRVMLLPEGKGTPQTLRSSARPGVHEFAHLEPGFGVLEIEHLDTGPFSAIARVQVEAGRVRTIRMDDLSGTTPCTVRGRLLQGGQGVADARLSFERLGTRGDSSPRTRIRTRRMSSARCTTDAMGHFEVSVLPGPQSVSVREGSSLIALLDVDVRGVEQELALQLTGSLRGGTVVDSQERPLASIEVRATPEFPGPEAVTNRTSVAGKYHFFGLEPGPWRLEVGGPPRKANHASGVDLLDERSWREAHGLQRGWVPATYSIVRTHIDVLVKEGPQTFPTIVVPSAGRALGICVDTNGDPVGGALVYLRSDGEWDRYAATDTQGSFKVDRLVPGTYDVFARTNRSSGPSHSMASTGLLTVLPEAARPIPKTWVLEPAGGLRIQATALVSETKEACQTSLRVQRQGGSSLPAIELDSDWVHLLHGLLPGSYEVIATNQAGRSLRILETVEEGSEGQVQFHFGR